VQEDDRTVFSTVGSNQSSDDILELLTSYRLKIEEYEAIIEARKRENEDFKLRIEQLIENTRERESQLEQEN
jgi:hypothetical protein